MGGTMVGTASVMRADAVNGCDVALAAYLDSLEEMSAFEIRRYAGRSDTADRGDTADRVRAERFFYEHAGWSYRADRETAEEGRLRCAARLADAEEWACAVGAWAEWVEDGGRDRSGIEHDGPLYGCILWLGESDDGDNAPDGRNESLWGIDLGADPDFNDPYKRVVVAELALEMMPG